MSYLFVKRTLQKDVFAGACDGLRRHEMSVVVAAEGVPGGRLRDTGEYGAFLLEVQEVLLRAGGGW
jgi:hypothetical protein